MKTCFLIVKILVHTFKLLIPGLRTIITTHALLAITRIFQITKKGLVNWINLTGTRVLQNLISFISLNKLQDQIFEKKLGRTLKSTVTLLFCRINLFLTKGIFLGLVLALYTLISPYTLYKAYKHTTWIPRWNDVETAVSTSFQRGIHMVCFAE